MVDSEKQGEFFFFIFFAAMMLLVMCEIKYLFNLGG